MPDDVVLPFDRSEYADRLARTRAAMERRRLEWLLVTDPSNMGWLTGYDAWSFYTHQGVVVTLDRDPVYWGRAQDAVAAQRTVWMGEDRIYPYPDHFVQNPEQHPMEHLGALLVDLGLADRPIGVELDNYYYSAAADRSPPRARGPGALVDAKRRLKRERARKSPPAQAYMRIPRSKRQRG
jgi:ectoine hydrolase